jgi:SAM-dependent methyltransferase
MDLLIGAGASRKRKMYPHGRKEWSGLVTMDRYDRHGADVVHDLDDLPYPFESDWFDEIHAYAVLEHCGRQGDWRFFFCQFSEFWRILKPDGVLVGFVPTRESPWAWGDPSHTRIITGHQFTFLDQTEYTKQVGVTTMSDFRDVYRADFDRGALFERDRRLYFELRAVKPARVE